MRALLTLLLSLVLAGPAFAQSAKPPQVTPAAEAQAAQIVGMPSGDPVARFNQLLEARKLDEAALFALAARVPGVVEQIVTPRYQRALAYIEAMPAQDLGRVRRGETVIRTLKDVKKRQSEYEAAKEMVEEAGLNSKKFEAVRVGPLEGRVMRVEVTAKGEAHTIEMAWPSTPERDDESRNRLAKHFGGRPSTRSQGVGARLPLVDGSFEKLDALGTSWTLEQGPDLGGGTPVAEVTVDGKVSIDGGASLRFYATQRTRGFRIASQRITVAPYTSLKANAQLKTENIRPEFLQKPTDIYLEMSYLDIAGNPVGTPSRAVGNAETHTWQALEVTGTVPGEAAYVRIALFCGLSGTAWFDGVTVEIGD